MATSVASTILSQLGGNHFVTMTGAKRLVSDDNSLRFNIGKNGSKANMVKVILRGDDTYTMQFWNGGREVNTYKYLTKYMNQGLSKEEYNKAVEEAIAKAMKKAEPKLLKEYNGIYGEELQKLFTEYTYLYTSLF